MFFRFSTIIGTITLAALAIGSSVQPENEDYLSTKPIYVNVPQVAEFSFMSKMLEEYNMQPSLKQDTPKDSMSKFVEQKLNVAKGDYIIVNEYESKMPFMAHFYLKQQIHGVEVFNGDINVNLDAENKVINYSDSFSHNIDGVSAWSPHAVANYIRPKEAYQIMAKHINVPASNSDLTEIMVQDKKKKQQQHYHLLNAPLTTKSVIITPAYVHIETGQVVPAWKIEAHFKYGHFMACVSTTGTKILLINNAVKN
ncbi:hypothetical protein BDF19DRAFT_440118 [Syncephalis fuscata]|nr:hypothetical protein BDF19DRAFT_440118 [Syncephalis fuscata]